MRGRPSRLDNPDFAKAVAEAYVSGMNFTDIGEMFGVTANTISIWCKNPVVVAHASRIAQERVLRIVRKTDAAIEKRLESVDDETKISTDLLLKIRRELDRSIHLDAASHAQNSEPDAMSSIVGKLEENPELARQLQEWVAGKKQ